MFFVRKIFNTFLLSLLLVIVSGCGGGSGETDTHQMKVTKMLEHNSTKVVTIEGRNGERLQLTIPPLSLQQAEMNLTITLKYEGKIPFIITDKELQFTAPVILSFYSPHMVEQNMTLIYKSVEGNIYLPVTITDGTFTANLWHFSIYGFAERPDRGSVLEDIHSRLTAYKRKAEEEKFEDIGTDVLDDLQLKISLLPESDQGVLIADLAYIIEKSIDNSIKYYTATPPCYFQNLCVCDAFEKTMDRLYDAYSYLKGFSEMNKELLYEEDKILSTTLLDQLLSLARKFKDDSYAAWKQIPLPDCGPELDQYVSCSLAYQYQLEVIERFYMFEQIGGQKYQELLSTLESKLTEGANRLLQNPTGACDCLKRYEALLMTHFSQNSATVIAALVEASSGECADQCPYLWELTFRQNGTVNANECFGTALDDTATMTVSGYASFGPVMFYPDHMQAPDMTNKEFTACQPYMDRHTAIEASAQHFVVDGEESDTMSLELDYTDHTGVDALLIGDTYILPYSKFEPQIVKQKDFALTKSCAVTYEFRYLK